jgi:hypothetical protein
VWPDGGSVDRLQRPGYGIRYRGPSADNDLAVGRPGYDLAAILILALGYVTHNGELTGLFPMVSGVGCRVSIPPLDHRHLTPETQTSTNGATANGPYGLVRDQNENC